MDSFAEPYTRQGDDISIEQVRQNIALLEDEHRKAGMTLSGRIIHVCHYLPIAASFEQSQQPTDIGVLSPPATPPTRVSEVSPTDVAEPAEGEPEHKPGSPWTLTPRHGHAAMISGIRSLSHSHEQLIVGWTGDIFSSPTDKVPVDSITPQNRADFEDALNNHLPKESDPDDERDRKTKYIPVWLDDKVAHGHYDGYCKQSTAPIFYVISANSQHVLCSPMAVVPLPALARCRHRILLRRLPLPILRGC